MAGRQASTLMGALARRAAAGPRAVLPARGGGGGPVAPRGRTTEPVSGEGKRGVERLSASVSGRALLAHHGLGLVCVCVCVRVHGRSRAGERVERTGAGRRDCVARAASCTHTLSPDLSLSSPPTQLAAEDELTWDDGTVNPEYCVDRWDDVGKVKEKRRSTLAPH